LRKKERVIGKRIKARKKRVTLLSVKRGAFGHLEREKKKPAAASRGRKECSSSLTAGGPWGGK